MNHWRPVVTDIVQHTDEWREFRKFGPPDNPFPLAVGASRIFQAIGRDRMAIAELLGQPVPVTKAMQAGTAMEPVLRAEYENRFGVRGAPRVCYSAIAPWVLASLDWLRDDGTYLAEFKMINRHDFDNVRDGRLPGRMFAQVQMQLACSGAVFGDLYAATWNSDERATVVIPPSIRYQVLAFTRAACMLNEMCGTYSTSGLWDLLGPLREIDDTSVRDAWAVEMGQ